MGFGVNLDQTATKSICDRKLAWHGIFMKTLVTLFTGSWFFYLPCKKCEEDSHGNSMSFFVTTWLGGSLVQIDAKFRDYSMSFIQVVFVSHAGTWRGFWTSSSHEIFMGFSKEMMGFPSESVSFSSRNCRQKDMRKSMLHFFRACIIFLRVHWSLLYVQYTYLFRINDQ